MKKIALCSDAELVVRCLAGHADSWELLFRRHNEDLLDSVARSLGRAPGNQALAEEIVERVWVKLCRNPERLRKYDSRRRSLAVFLALLARYEIRLQRRALRRQAQFCPIQGRDLVDPRTLPGITDCEWQEFLAIVTDRDRAFLRKQLRASSHLPRLTRAEQKRFERLVKKVTAYFGCS